MNEQYKQRLVELLSEDVSASVKRERAEFDSLAAPNGDRIVLFGAGGVGRRTLAGLRAAGIEPLAFADNNAAIWGATVDGLQVLSPNDAVELHGSSAAFVITIWRGEPTDGMRDHAAALRLLGCATIVPFGPLYWKYAEQLLPHYSIDLPHKVLDDREAVLNAFDLLGDEPSRREFAQQIAWRLWMHPNEFDTPVGPAMYFPRHLTQLRDDEVFIDCGAFDGDTIEAFLHETDNKFDKVVAFEPDSGNLDKLRTSIANLPADICSRIRVAPVGVGDRNATVGFSADATLASAVSDNGSAQIECVTLDDALADARPTYVKIDVEGYELNAIRGARRILETQQPVLAVCSYHKQSHIWEIPLLVHDLQPDYAFAQVRYAVDAWETVTYAIPRDRLPA